MQFYLHIFSGTLLLLMDMLPGDIGALFYFSCDNKLTFLSLVVYKVS